MSKPTFDLKWAQTLDGQLCDDDDVSQWITGPRELKETHRLRAAYDAVMVGARTFLADRSRLTVRLVPLGPDCQQPVRLILDPKGALVAALRNDDGSLAMSLGDGARPTVAFVPTPAPDLHSPLFHTCAITIDFDDDARMARVELTRALARASEIAGRRIDNVLIEGGPRLIAFFLNRGLHRNVFVSIAPCLTGGSKHRIRVDRPLKDALRFDLDDLEILGVDLALRLSPLSANATG